MDITILPTMQAVNLESSGKSAPWNNNINNNNKNNNNNNNLGIDNVSHQLNALVIKH
jgi:hypothetical protein